MTTQQMTTTTKPTIIRFPAPSQLAGYGYCEATDRVISFKVKPMGVPVQYRTMYVLNKGNFSHKEIVKAAMSLKHVYEHTIKEANDHTIKEANDHVESLGHALSRTFAAAAIAEAAKSVAAAAKSVADQSIMIEDALGKLGYPSSTKHAIGVGIDAARQSNVASAGAQVQPRNYTGLDTIAPAYPYVIYSVRNQCSQYFFKDTTIANALELFAKRGEELDPADIRIVNVLTGEVTALSIKPLTSYAVSLG